MSMGKGTGMTRKECLVCLMWGTIATAAYMAAAILLHDLLT